MLTQMLDEAGTLNTLPLPQKRILMALAKRLQDRTDLLFMNTEELADSVGLGTQEQWKELLNLQETKNFIKGQMAAIAEIAQRKTFAALVQSALSGNHQAAKQVQEISGIFNQQDQNRTIVLHQIPRPPKNQPQQLS